MDQNNKGINFKEFLNPYLKNWKYFAGTAFLMAILAFYYIKIQAPVYKSQTSVLIKDAKKMSAVSGDIGMLQSLGELSGIETSSIENEVGVFEFKSIIKSEILSLSISPVMSNEDVTTVIKKLNLSDSSI
jgi:tyrosine-protein kinase Etk/Wzc